LLFYLSILVLLITRTSADRGTVDDEEFDENKEDKYFIYFTVKIKSEDSELALWELVKGQPEFKVAFNKLPKPKPYGHRVSQPSFIQFCQVMSSAHTQPPPPCPHP
jgi:hypothetical protein